MPAKSASAIQSGKMKSMIVPIEVERGDGTKVVVDKDQQPRPETSMNPLPAQSGFQRERRVTAATLWAE